MTFADWITSDSWMDYRQQQALRDLDDEVASLSSTLSRQYQESSRLRSELGSLRGSVEERLTRLTRSWDAPGASPLDLLEEDAFRADGSPLARLARTAGAGGCCQPANGSRRPRRSTHRPRPPR